MYPSAGMDSDTPQLERLRQTVSALMDEMGRESPESAEELARHVYDDLRKRARGYLRRERGNHTLQPTALVHEAYLRLVDDGEKDWKGRTHFLAAAAIAMRRILIDHARERGAAKRGGDLHRVTLNDAAALGAGPDVDVIALHDALERLEALNERHARVVELRFFAGLTTEEVAEVLGLSRATVDNDWRFAKRWLKAELAGKTD